MSDDELGFSSLLLGLSRATSSQQPNLMPDWIGDQLAGVSPEATRVFGRYAQIVLKNPSIDESG